MYIPVTWPWQPKSYDITFGDLPLGWHALCLGSVLNSVSSRSPRAHTHTFTYRNTYTHPLASTHTLHPSHTPFKKQDIYLALNTDLPVMKILCLYSGLRLASNWIGCFSPRSVHLSFYLWLFFLSRHKNLPSLSPLRVLLIHTHTHMHRHTTCKWVHMHLHRHTNAHSTDMHWSWLPDL